MSTTFNLAAIDLGASSGRVMLARFQNQRLTLEESHRFQNTPVRVHDRIHWDVLRLFDEIKAGLKIAGKNAPLSSMGLDTWGVDFALLDRDDHLVGNPFHYRDPHTNGILQRAFELVSRSEIFERTGLQFMQINTLYQLLAMRDSAALERARTFLMIPDLFNFWLTDCKANEYTDATTTQFYNPGLDGYDLEMLSRFDLPTDIFPPIVPAGSQLGSLIPSIARDVGLPEIPVIAPACHDTGSAIAAVPYKNHKAAYISSGTWSLVGVEVNEPVITPQSLAYNFTNEGGVYGSTRLLKNVAGMWLVQECRRAWNDEGRSYSWREITQLAESAKKFGPLIDPDHADFLNPRDMPEAIRLYWIRKDQAGAAHHAVILRCIFESLALKYRWVVSCLEEMLVTSLDEIHMIGGGSQNQLLCQLTADALQKQVISGPVEATAIGNALVQAVTLGHLDSLADGRELVARSFPMKIYQPGSPDGWEDAYKRFLQLMDS